MSDAFEWKRTVYGQAGTRLEKRELHSMMEWEQTASRSIQNVVFVVFNMRRPRPADDANDLGP